VARELIRRQMVLFLRGGQTLALGLRVDALFMLVKAADLSAGLWTEKKACSGQVILFGKMLRNGWPRSAHKG
jgi:hypothetical protein